MTVTKVARLFSLPEALIEDWLLGVTIVPDQEPDPRPDFRAMTTCDVLDWCFENCDGLYEQYRDIRRAIIDFANEIADRKGMGR